MIAALMLGFREALEAALIVSVVAASLKKAGMQRLFRPMWIGVGAAVAASLGVGALLTQAGIAFEGRTEEIFEGVLMLVAAGVLSWAVIWMSRHGRCLEQQLKDKTNTMASTGSWIGIFGLVFAAVVREGIELALFLIATRVSADASSVYGGAALGVAAAVAFGGLLYTGTIRLRLRTFLRVTAALLVLVAAGLFAHGIHELQEAGVVPIFIEHVWNLNPVLDEGSIPGQILKAMFGYNGNPSLLEVVSFASFLLGAVGVGLLMRKRRDRGNQPCNRIDPVPSAAD